MLTLHTRGQKSKGRRSSKCLHDNSFLPKQWTFEGSLGRTRLETQTMVERPLDFFHKKISTLTRYWSLDWRGCLGREYTRMLSLSLSMGLTFEGFTVWPPKSRGGGSSWPEVWTMGFAFGGFTLCPSESSNSCILLAFSNPFFWTLNKVWSFNPTDSRPGRPWCGTTLTQSFHVLCAHTHTQKNMWIRCTLNHLDSKVVPPEVIINNICLYSFIPFGQNMWAKAHIVHAWRERRGEERSSTWR